MSRSRSFLFIVALLFVFALVYNKLRIGVYIHMSLFQGVVVFGVIVVGLFLVLDHFFNRSR